MSDALDQLCIDTIRFLSVDAVQKANSGHPARAASGKVMNAFALKLPALTGGSADLDPSTKTALKDLGDFNPPAATSDDTQGPDGGGWSPAGRNLHFGVREHAMGAIVNGLAAHGGFVPYGATFLIFSDYMRPAIRLAALAKLHVVHVFTQDSIALGEDGPTHQPVLPPDVPARLAVELGVAQGWHRYIGDRGEMLGVERFGASAPAEILLREYGFTVENVVLLARKLLAGLGDAHGP